MLEIDIKLLPFQGVTNERALTQGVASLALGSVHHWTFSPSLLNPKVELYYHTSSLRKEFLQQFDIAHQVDVNGCWLTRNSNSAKNAP